jgi:neopullulanase
MAGRDRAAYELAALLQATLPGAPCIYYGNEVGIEGGSDPDCRRSFPWDEAAWDRAGIEWTRAVLAARHALPALRRGPFRVAGAAGDALAFVRGAAAGGAAVLVVINAGDGTVKVPVSVPELAGSTLGARALPGGSDEAPAVTIAVDGSASVSVPPRRGRILVPSAA